MFGLGVYLEDRTNRITVEIGYQMGKESVNNFYNALIQLLSTKSSPKKLLNL